MAAEKNRLFTIEKKPFAAYDIQKKKQEIRKRATIAGLTPNFESLLPHPSHAPSPLPNQNIRILRAH